MNVDKNHNIRIIAENNSDEERATAFPDSAFASWINQVESLSVQNAEIAQPLFAGFTPGSAMDNSIPMVYGFSVRPKTNASIYKASKLKLRNWNILIEATTD